MGFSEFTQFAVEGSPKTIRRMRNLLRRSRFSPSTEGTLPWNELMVRLGDVTPDELEAAYDGKGRLEPFDAGWNSLLRKGCAPTATGISDVQYHPKTAPGVLRFSVDAWKNCFCGICLDILHKHFPDTVIRYNVFDELIAVCDGDSEPKDCCFTNDRDGKYFGVWNVSEGERRVWKKKNGRRIECVYPVISENFASESDARAFAEKRGIPQECVFQIATLVEDGE